MELLRSNPGSSLFLGAMLGWKLFIEKKPDPGAVLCDFNNENFVFTQLMTEEAKNHLQSPTINTVTFYEGTPPVDFIVKKFTEICEKNPWLLGKLVQKKGGPMFVKHPRDTSCCGDLVKVVDLPKLTIDMGFNEIAAYLDPYFVKVGTKCLNKNEPLTRIVIAKITEDKFAIIFSLSHVFADGYTYYHLFNMFNSTVPVSALIFERDHNFMKDVDKLMRGGYDSWKYLLSPGVIFSALGSIFFGPKLTPTMHRVNYEWLAEQKKAYAAEHPGKFISNNDIITSEFFTHSSCNSVFVALNCRQRIPHISSNHAGNYEALVGFQRVDFATPALVRSAWTDYRRAISGDFPGFTDTLKSKFGGCTTWATFYHDLVLPGCTMLFHRPVCDSTAFLPFENFVVIFHINQKELGILSFHRDMSPLEKSKVFKSRIL